MRQLKTRTPGLLAAPQLTPVRFIEDELVMLKTWVRGRVDQLATVRMVALVDGPAFFFPYKPVESLLVSQGSAGPGNRGLRIGGDRDHRGVGAGEGSKRTGKLERGLHARPHRDLGRDPGNRETAVTAGWNR